MAIADIHRMSKSDSRIPDDLIAIHPAGVAGVILAGGQARRMGGADKGRILVGGRTILDRQIEALAPQVAALAISANAPERYAALGLPVLADDEGAAGPLAGLLAGLEWAQAAGFSRLLTAPCDTPFLPADLVMRLGREGPAVAASNGRVHPVIGLWPVGLLDDLRRFVLEEGGRKAQSWAERSGAVSVEWPDDSLFNVNCDADRLEAERLTAVRPRQAGAVVLAQGQSGQALLQDFADECRNRGLRVGGLIQQGPKETAELVALDDGQAFPIMQKLGSEACCAVDGQAVAASCMALRRAVETRCDLIIVNKFGHLEEDGDGLVDEMMAAMAEGIPLLTTVSLGRADSWLAFTGGLTTLLPADAGAIRRWWRG